MRRGKLRAVRLDALLKEINLKVSQLAADLTAASHSMAWLTWAANHEILTKEKVESYDAEMHVILPKVLGDVVAVAALDEELEEIADDIARELYQLDAELGDACILFAKDSASARALFIAVTPRVLNFWFETLKKLSVAARGKLKLFMEASAFNRSHSQH